MDHVSWKTKPWRVYIVLKLSIFFHYLLLFWTNCCVYVVGGEIHKRLTYSHCHILTCEVWNHLHVSDICTPYGICSVKHNTPYLFIPFSYIFSCVKFLKVDTLFRSLVYRRFSTQKEIR